MSGKSPMHSPATDGSGVKGIEARRLAIEALKAGQDVLTILATLPVSRSSVYSWRTLLTQGRDPAARRTRSPGRPALLDVGKRTALLNRLLQPAPHELAGSAGLWTPDSVRRLIEHDFGIALGRTSVPRLLDGMGLVAPHPRDRALRQRPRAVRDWERDMLPTLRLWARSDGEVLYAASAALQWNADGADSSAMSAAGGTRPLTLLYARGKQRCLRFRLLADLPDSGAIVQFMEDLRVGRGAIVLVVDQPHLVAVAPTVDYLEAMEDCIRVVALPPSRPARPWPRPRGWRRERKRRIGWSRTRA